MNRAQQRREKKAQDKEDWRWFRSNPNRVYRLRHRLSFIPADRGELCLIAKVGPKELVRVELELDDFISASSEDDQMLALAAEGIIARNILETMGEPNGDCH